MKDEKVDVDSPIAMLAVELSRRTELTLGLSLLTLLHLNYSLNLFYNA